MNKKDILRPLHGWLKSNSLLLLCLALSLTVKIANGQFLSCCDGFAGDNRGVIVGEVECEDPQYLWFPPTKGIIAGYSGLGYIQWNPFASSTISTTSAGLSTDSKIMYRFTPRVTGTHRLLVRSAAMGATSFNDVYVQFSSNVKALRAIPEQYIPSQTVYNIKLPSDVVFRMIQKDYNSITGASFSWNTVGSIDNNNATQYYMIVDLVAGNDYYISLSGCSNKFVIDKFVLFPCVDEGCKSNSVSASTAQMATMVCATTASSIPAASAEAVDCNSCKEQCSNACEYNNKINQCWGIPDRYIECLCQNGTRYKFSGCGCKHPDCANIASFNAIQSTTLNSFVMPIASNLVSSVKPATTRCGLSWADANNKCGKPCIQNGDCEGKYCFKDLVMTPCDAAKIKSPIVKPTITSAVSSVKPTSVRCGLSWADANDNCGKPCTLDGDCGGGYCFKDLAITPCDVATLRSSKLNPAPSSAAVSITATPSRIIVESLQGKTTPMRTNTVRLLAYLTSWNTPVSAIPSLQTSKANGYILSFGQWNPAGNIMCSDNICNIPVYNPDYIGEEAYVVWTNLKYNKPSLSFLMAFGGQTYEAIWGYLATIAQREIIANNLVTLLTTKFPVYKKNAAPSEVIKCMSYSGANCDYKAYQLVGHVELDGIDFDYEKGTRLTESDNNNLKDLIAKIRAKIGYGRGKVLSLTTYHVGADPVQCCNYGVMSYNGIKCSYTDGRGSHCGEALSILNTANTAFDFFNVMAYDSDRTFMYQEAMQNYANAIGGDRSKIVLGLTINKQWAASGTFVQTKPENLARSTWQRVNGFGGFFLWNFGMNDAGLTIPSQVQYFNDLTVA